MCLRKDVFIMETIFPREEKPEGLFEKIVENKSACERLEELFYEKIDEAADLEDALDNRDAVCFTKALLNAYLNRDLSAFLMAICHNSTFDLLRNAYLIPIRFDDKGKTNPIILTDENGKLRKGVSVPEKKYEKFYESFQKKEQIPGVTEYLAYGFMEEHEYNQKDMSVNAIEISKHLGILLLYQMPEEEKRLTEPQEYALVWENLMELQEMLPRAFMYYGRMEEGNKEVSGDMIGIFLPIRYFENAMERNIQQANGIVLGFREKINAELGKINE